jgi:thiol-disulfide isomerase/thioredoxin
MKKICLLAMLLALLGVNIAMAEQRQYKGKLSTDLILSNARTDYLEPASAKTIAKLPVRPVSGERVVAGSLKISENLDYAVAVVLSPSGRATLYFDSNRNGRFEQSERYELAEDAPEVGKNGEERVKEQAAKRAEIDLPVSLSSLFPRLRVQVAFWERTPYAPLESKAEGSTPEKKGAQKYFMLGRTCAWSASAVIDIGGQKTLFRYSVNLDKKTIDPTRGLLEVDCNGDGKIDDSSNVEVAGGKGAPVVFRVGEHYVATKSVDIDTGDVIVEERLASEYTRIERALNGGIPNFTFKDIDGKTHELAEYRGKYLLMDFWGTWCAPCLRELPYLKAAYEKHHALGFEILGMNMESHDSALAPEEYARDIQKVRKFVFEKGYVWTQATQESIEDLTRNRFLVEDYPTELLLDPNGKIVSMDLRGEKLAQALEKLLDGGDPRPMPKDQTKGALHDGVPGQVGSTACR